MFMMQNISEKGVSLVFRASEGRGRKKIFPGASARPPYLLVALTLCPQKQGPGYATGKKEGEKGNGTEWVGVFGKRKKVL